MKATGGGERGAQAAVAPRMSVRTGAEALDSRDGTPETVANFHALQHRVGNHAVQHLLHGAPAIVQETVGSSGHPLEPGARAAMERRFGEDFGAVRVHDDRQAADSARAVNAVAYTVGQDVVFGRGQYDPASSAGRRLMAHELAHVIQQRGQRTRTGWDGLRLAASRDSAEREASMLADSVAPDVPPVLVRSPLQVQRQAAGPAGKAGSDEIAEYEADRKRFSQAQDEQFEAIGATVRKEILTAAGMPDGRPPATSDEALKVVQTWGVTADSLIKHLPVLGASTAGKVTGSQKTASLAQQEQDLIAKLSPKGQKTYQAMLARVRAEPFWKQRLDSIQVSIFPDLAGTNRYGGYTQRGTGQTAEGLTTTGYVIHISKDRLEAGQIEESAAILIHELSHTLHEPNVTDRVLKSLNDRLSVLLADHPQIAALRKGAPDADEARRTHIKLISQLLYEQTGYAEAEIFTHLQQLTHQPEVKIGQEKVSGSRYILLVVERYMEQLRRIGLPPKVLGGILGTLARRVDLLYQARIAATAAGSKERELLETNRRLAQMTLELAISESAAPAAKGP
jgi:hypothetical protein